MLNLTNEEIKNVKMQPQQVELKKEEPIDNFNKDFVLKIRNLNKFYGDKHVLRDINLTIRPGEKVALLGANGAGKTTLVEIIAQLREPTSGTLEYSFGTTHKDIVKQIGIQFQENIYPSGYRVKHLIDFYLEVADSDIHIGSSEDLIKQFHLTGLENRELKSLSGGQKQRLNVLLALINSPKFVILDEISTGLDVESQNDIKAFIIDYIDKSGATLLLVSHNMEEVEHLTTRIVAIGAGKIKYDLPLVAIKKQYKDMSIFINKFFDEAKEIYEIRENAENAKEKATRNLKDIQKQLNDLSKQKHVANDKTLFYLNKAAKSESPEIQEVVNIAILNRKNANQFSKQLAKLEKERDNLAKKYNSYLSFENEAKAEKVKPILDNLNKQIPDIIVNKKNANKLAYENLTNALNKITNSNIKKATENASSIQEEEDGKKQLLEQARKKLEEANEKLLNAIHLETKPGKLFVDPIQFSK